MRRAPGGAALLTCLAAIALGGCGEDEFANAQRPPAPITVSAAITEDGVSVSPPRFGAGPIYLVVTNQTSASQELTLRTEDVGNQEPIEQQTGPINPSDTASLKANVPQGTYRVSVSSDSIPSATVRVGSERESAQDQLLLP